MQNFIISARKYRPQTFDTVIGQTSITNTLKNAIKHNQLAQAFLFCGPRGVGKTTCARILAKTINCANLSPTFEACDICPSCVSFNENSSFNIYELDGASNNSVDDIRSLVDQVRIPPQMGIYKVYIIDEVHMLSPSAFNAFLKTLEEPPPYAKFILATTEKHKILPTIISRCQIFDFQRITIQDIANHLSYVANQEQIHAEEDALHIIAQKADGAMRDALSIFDQLVSFAGDQLTYSTVLENLNVLDYEYYFSVTKQILESDIPATLLTIHQIIEKGFDGQHFLIGFGEHLRNLMVCKDPSTVKLLETAPTIRQRYLAQATDCEPGILLKLLDITNRCDINYKTSNNKRLLIELALMQMCMLTVKEGSAPPARSPLKPLATQPLSPPVAVKKAEPDLKPLVVDPPGKVRSYKDQLPGTISIKQTEPVEIHKDSPGEPEDSSEKPATPFTLQQLQDLWNEYADLLQRDSPHMFNTLKSRLPILGDHWAIEFETDNRILEEELNQKRNELLDFLKSRLNNYFITLQMKVQDKPTSLKPYTNKEKFEKMATKNPAIQDLKDQLDLDIEY